VILTIFGEKHFLILGEISLFMQFMIFLKNIVIFG
jgi:hypothetical protein